MNVLCLGGRVIGVEVAVEIARAFLAAVESDEQRHLRRRAEVRRIERTRGRELRRPDNEGSEP
jgi:ribose 5-phosphate isomerase B